MLVIRYTSATVAITLALTSLQAAWAAPIYHVLHLQDTFNTTTLGGEVGPQGTPIDYDFAYQEVDAFYPEDPNLLQPRNLSEVHANVGQGFVGVFDRAFNNGVYAPQRQEVVATFLFDVFFGSGTSDPIDVSMNLELSGQIFGTGLSHVNILAGASSHGALGQSGGSYAEVNGDIIQSGMLASFSANGAVQPLSTGLLQNIPVNVPVQFVLQLSTINGFHPTNPRISFNNALNLATGDDVFAVPAGITVDSTDANIVNNSFAIPEPSTLALWAIGMTGLLGCGFRCGKKRRPTPTS
jgi:hypothetical protein